LHQYKYTLTLEGGREEERDKQTDKSREARKWRVGKGRKKRRGERRKHVITIIAFFPEKEQM
jgi:hypothetical protein